VELTAKEFLRLKTLGVQRGGKRGSQQDIVELAIGHKP
jgi:hypothetical protein